MMMQLLLTEYLTYTLTDVTIASFSTSSNDFGEPLDTIQLAYDSVTESYSPINSDGTLGPANIAQYDRKTGHATSGILADRRQPAVCHRVDIRPEQRQPTGAVGRELLLGCQQRQRRHGPSQLAELHPDAGGPALSLGCGGILLLAAT